MLEGLKEGARGTLLGVSSGLHGLYHQPIQGQQQEGVKGFLKGSIRGLGGALVKPVSGALDFVMKTSEGAHNMLANSSQ